MVLYNLTNMSITAPVVREREPTALASEILGRPRGQAVRRLEIPEDMQKKYGLDCRPLCQKINERAGRTARDARSRNSIVELGRVFGRLEQLGIVRDEELRVLCVADQADALIPLVHAGRAPGARDRRGQVLFVVLLLIEPVARGGERTRFFVSHPPPFAS